jgi:hypothetical protein
MSRKLLFIVAISILGSAHLWASSLLSNGGFETGSLGAWSVGTDYCAEVSSAPCDAWHISTVSHQGSFSAEDQGDTELLQSVTPTPAILVTQASFWFKQDPAMVFAVELFYQDGSVDPFFFFPKNSAWHQYDLMGDLETGKVLTGIGFWGYSGFDSNGPSWLDSVVLNARSSFYAPIETPEPATMLLVGVGLVALGNLRQRR